MHYATKPDFLKPFFFFFALFMSGILYYQYGQEQRANYNVDDWISFKQIAVAEPKTPEELPIIILDGVVKKDFNGTLKLKTEKISDSEVVIVCESDEKTMEFKHSDTDQYNTIPLNWSDFFNNCPIESGNTYRVIGTVKIAAEGTVIESVTVSNIFSGLPH